MCGQAAAAAPFLPRSGGYRRAEDLDDRLADLTEALANLDRELPDLEALVTETLGETGVIWPQSVNEVVV